MEAGKVEKCVAGEEKVGRHDIHDIGVKGGSHDIHDIRIKFVWQGKSLMPLFIIQIILYPYPNNCHTPDHVHSISKS